MKPAFGYRPPLTLVLLAVFLVAFIPFAAVDAVRSHLARRAVIQSYEDRGKSAVLVLMSRHAHLLEDMHSSLPMLAAILNENGRLRSPAQVEYYLKLFLEYNQGCNNIALAWPDGSLAASAAGPADRQVGPAAWPVLARALASGSVASGSGGISLLNQRAIIPFAYPLKDGAGRAFAALVAGASLTWLHEQIDHLENLQGVEVSVFDEADTLLASLPARPELLGRPSTVPLAFGDSATGELAVHEGRYIDGTERLFIVGRFGGGIRIAAAILKDAYLTEISRHFAFNHLFFWAALAVSLFLSRMVAHGLVIKPLKRALESWENLAQGLHAAAITLPRLAGRELVEIADAFEATAGRIQTHSQELEAARRRADDANQAKSDFLANMSHEVRTPIAGIAGLAEALLSEETNDDRRRRLAMIDSSSRHLLALVNDFLDISSIEQGRFFLKNQSFDLGEFLRRELDFLASQAVNKGLHASIQIDPVLAQPVQGDANRLWQVITNLAGNAIKFTTAGRVTLLAEATEAGAQSIGLRFSVEDSGPGIPADRMEKIFQPYYRIEDPLRKQREGSGLGLWITRALVEKMGGTIEVESQVGRGSRFVVQLSFARDGVRPGTRSVEGAPDAALRGLKVLVAEDNQIGLEVVRFQLDRAGCRLSLTDEGGEAVRRALAEDFDFALFDVQMPGLNGVDAVQAVRAAELESGRPRLPIIALSAYSQESDHSVFLRAGFDACLVKPLRLAELVCVLRGNGK